MPASSSSATTRAAPRSLTDAYGYNPAQEIDSCGVGLVVALDGKRRRDVVVAGIDALKAVWHRGAVDADGKTGDGAGIHVEIPQDFFKDHVREFERRGARGRPHRRRHGVPAAHRPRRAGALPHHRRDRDPALRPHHPGLAPGAGRHLGDRREGQRDAARDRADPDRPRRPQARQPRVREAALHPAPAHGEGGDRREHRRVLRLLALAAARSSTRACSSPSICRPSIPTCSTSASPRASRSSTSAIRPTPSRNGSWPSRSACWRTTARSTPSWATSTG